MSKVTAFSINYKRTEAARLNKKRAKPYLCLKLQMKNILFLGLFLVLGCKTNYTVVPFAEQGIPTPPNYQNPEAWAVLPASYPKEATLLSKESPNKAVDVFYVYPTLLTDRKNTAWNADVTLEATRQEVLNTPVQYQASAWAAAGNVYVPYYRQGHYRGYVNPYTSDGKKAFAVAYEDVKRAFTYYLEHYNQGKPIILASHSQGSHHTKQIVKDFFDNTPLQNQLIAAYLVGIKVLPDEFKTIKPMYSASETGGFVSWNTYKKGHLPKTYASWYKGGVAVNPITWDDASLGTVDNHKGVLNSDLKIYPKALTVERIDGMIWASVPKIPKRFWLSFIKNYHFADINLFWADIQQNALERVMAWKQLNGKI